MPKHRRKDKAKKSRSDTDEAGGGAGGGESDDDQMSIVSDTTTASDVMSGGDEPDVAESTEDEIRDIIQTYTDSGKKKNKDVLIKNLSKILQTRPNCWTFLTTTIETVTECLIDSLRRSKSDVEKLCAAECLSLLALHSMNIDFSSESYYERCLKDPLIQTISDATNPVKLRMRAAQALALNASLLVEEAVMIESAMNCLEAVFSSLVKGDNTVRAVTDDVAEFYACVLLCWSYLIQFNSLLKIDDKLVRRLHVMLSSADIEVKVSACHAIAVYYEYVWGNRNEKFAATCHNTMLEEIEGLSKQCVKRKSKKDMKVEKASFRELYKFLKTCEYPADQVITIGGDKIELMNWIERITYDFFTSVLRGSIRNHLTSNPGVRTTFGLPPYPPDLNPAALANMLSHAERNRLRQAIAGNRKQRMQKLRSKRVANFTQVE